MPINTKCLTFSRSYYVYFNEVCALLTGLTFELTLLNKLYCFSIICFEELLLRYSAVLHGITYIILYFAVVLLHSNKIYFWNHLGFFPLFPNMTQPCRLQTQCVYIYIYIYIYIFFFFTKIQNTICIYASFLLPYTVILVKRCLTTVWKTTETM